MKSQLTSPRISFARKSHAIPTAFITLVCYLCGFFLSINELHGQLYDSINSSSCVINVDSWPDEEIPYNALNGINYNLNLPDDDGGILPDDILYVPEINRIFVYGGKKLMILNSQTHDHIATLNISSYGRYYPSYFSPFFLKNRLLAYNSNGYLYCSTEGIEIVVINTTNNSIENIITPPEGLINRPGVVRETITLDEPNELLYWTVAYGTDESYLFVYSVSNNDFDLLYHEYFFGKIWDFEYSPITQKYYISIADFTYDSYISIFNSQNYELINTIYAVHDNAFYSVLKYFQNEELNINEIICTPYETGYDYDGVDSLLFINVETDEYMYKEIPADAVFSVVKSQSTEKLYFAYYKDYFENYVPVDVCNGVLECTIDDQFNITWDEFNYECNTGKEYYNYPMDICFDDNNAILCCSSKSSVNLINIQTHEINSVSGYLQNFFNKIFFNSNTEEFIISSFTGGSIEFINSSGELNESIQTGCHGFWGFYNESNNKVYFYNKYPQDRSKIISVNTDTDERSIVFEGLHISGCLLDKLNNLILISSYQDDTIHIIPPEPGNPPLIDHIFLNTNNATCYDIFITEGDKLYCIAYEDQLTTNLEIWNATDFTFETSIQINNLDLDLDTIWYPKTYFYSDPVTKMTWMTVDGASPDTPDALICIKNNNDVEYLKIVENPRKICRYDDQTGFVYLLTKENHAFSIYESLSGELNEIIDDDISFLDLEYSPESNYIYAAVRNVNPDPQYFIAEVKIFDCESGSFLTSTINTYGYPTALKYNDHSNTLYILTPFNNADNYQMEMIRFDEDNYIIDRLCFNQNESALTRFEVADIIINSEDNELYTCSAFSNVNIIEEDHGCTSEDYNDYTIVGGLPATWSEDKYINKYIHIEDGGSLTINNDATIYFKTNAKIIIKPGGKLIVDNATLTRACTGYWAGIEVWGTAASSENQFPDENGNYTQGFIELKNQATIEYALCGILTAERVFPSELNPFSTGGIIFAEDAIFKNNIVSVEIHHYTNHHPVSGEEFPNLCRFRDCRFFIDDDHTYQLNNYEYMVSLDMVDGITFYNCQFDIEDLVLNTNTLPEKMVFLNDCEDMDFKGCDFQNNFSFTECPLHLRGTGIYAQNSEVNIESICIQSHPEYGCIWDTTLFKGLTYGIHASTDRSLMPFRVDVANFEDNVSGIYLSGYDFAEITTNRFIMNNGFTSEVDTLIGLYLDHCNAYHVENNTFEGSQSLIETERLVGCVVQSFTGDANEIYNNSFENLNVGIESIGDNRSNGGLCIKCNDFTDNIHDVYIYAEDNSEGISPEQGVPDDVLEDNTLPAGNTFSSLGQSHAFDIHNELGGGINYYFHEFYAPELRIEPTENEGDVETDKNDLTQYTKEGACPSKLGGGGSPETPKSAMALNEQKADSTQTELYALIDGGDTDELNTDVVMSFPDEALEVRQQLLDESPYLSDSVMKSAIYKEDVLPNAMIRDVLVANPQSAKSDEVLGALDYRWDPMPDYMLDEVMAGEDSIGNKEIMEGQIRGYRHLRELAFNELVGIYLKDTINSWAVDSLIVLLQNETSLRSKYMLVLYCLEKEDTAQMNSVLNTIPTTFILSPSQQQTYQNYLTYSSILMALQHDSVNNHYPDSTQLAGLYSIADTCNNLPSVYARNLLIHLGLISYNEPVYFPMALNSSIAEIAPFKDINFPKQSSISLFPNPAGNYFIIEYRIEKAYEKAIVSIHDINGKLVNMISLKGKMNQTIIPTGEMNNSIYIVSLHVDNELEDSSKLTLLK